MEEEENDPFSDSELTDEDVSSASVMNGRSLSIWQYTVKLPTFSKEIEKVGSFTYWLG